MIDRRHLLIFSAASVMAPTVVLAASSPPTAFVTAIYKRVAAGKGSSGGQFIWLKEKDRRR